MPSNNAIKKSLNDRSLYMDALYKRSDSLSKILPYNEYSQGHGLFVQKDGSLGACFKIGLLEHEAVNPKELVEIVGQLKNWFALPSNCVLQVLFDQRMISKYDKRWKEITSAYSGGHQVSKLLEKMKIKMFRDQCRTENSSFPMTREGILSVRYFPNKRIVKSWSAAIRNGDVVLYSELSSFSREANIFIGILKQLLESTPLPLEQINGDELTDHLRRAFNPVQYYKREFASFNSNRPMSDQLIYNSPTPSFHGLEREGVMSRTITLKNPPEYAYASGFSNLLTLPFPIRMNVNVSFPSQGKIKRFFALKDFFLQNTPSQAARIQKADLDVVQNRLAQGERVVNTTTTLHIEGESEEVLDDRIRRITTALQRDLDCEGILESEIGLGLQMASLPLNYTPDCDKSAERHIPLLEKDASTFLPVFDSFRGFKHPMQIFLSRENNLINFNLFENETSNHTAILADTGSGKSSFIVDVLNSVKKQKKDPLIYVIDKKSSYQMVSKYFDGDTTIFDSNTKMPFSPFRGVFDDTKVKFLTNLLLTGIALTSKDFNPASEHMTALSKGLKLAYLKKQKEAGAKYISGELVTESVSKDVEISINDLITSLSSVSADPELEGITKYVEELLLKLRPFFGDGVYANYFETSPQPESENSSGFRIYDLDALDSDHKLQTLMTMSVIEEIRQELTKPENQKRGGVVVIEELGRLGTNPTAREFIIDFAETARKLGVALIGIAPRPQVFFESAAGQAMWGAADNFVFLKMGSQNVDYVQKQSKLIDDTNAEIIRSLKIKKGEYAELFYCNKDKSIQGAFKNIQSSFDRWTSSTDLGDLMNADQMLEECGDDRKKALIELSKLPTADASEEASNN